MTNSNSTETNTKKKELRRIEINELPKKIPNYKRSVESKDNLIYNWIRNWIIEGLKNKTVKQNELLPKKSDLAYYLGVSIGTVQNAIRYVEDEGHLESKQRIGTIIRDVNENNTKFRKLTSKRERAILELKKYILENKLTIGESLPTAKEICELLGSSANTTRLALENLSANGFIKSNYHRGTEANWTLVTLPVLTEEELKTDNNIETETLVDKVEEDLKNYIEKNYKIGDKLGSHTELAKILDVSIKTIHDAMKSLIEEGILLARRGRYGTIIIKMPYSQPLQPTNETNIFSNSLESAFYNYEKIEKYIKTMIKENYKVGDKIPSMENLATELSVSTNTIKKALQNLNEGGYVEIIRGRYGGTFVAEIPDEIEDSAFKWLALNPQYVKIYKN